MATISYKRVLHEVVTAYQANRRRGTSSTKTRGLVSGGGRKPWKQKGTGNARSGSIRSPLWRKGGIIFGPLPRSYYSDIPQQKKLQALQAALEAKTQSEKLVLVDQLPIKESKTKQLAQFLQTFKQSGSVVILADSVTTELSRSAANLPEVTLLTATHVNALDMMKARWVLATKPALEKLNARLKEVARG